MIQISSPLPVQASNTAKRAVFVIVPRFNVATLITMIEVLRVANYLTSTPQFTWDIIAFDGDAITASNGMVVQTSTPPEAISKADQVFVLASWGAEHYANSALTGWVRRMARAGAAVCGVELGCYILARAGVLAGKTATTHWSWLSGFQERFGEIDVVEQLYTIDDRVMTCAGGTGGVDLMLHLIGASHGAALAREVADQMLYHPIRSDVTPQRPMAEQASPALPIALRRAISIMERAIEEPVQMPEIARSVGVSQRQLERLFKQHIGCTAVQYGLLLRLQTARVLLISTQMSVRDIAAASGFNALSHFTHSFRKFFGRPPSEYREGWPKDQATPSWPGTLSDFLASQKPRP